ncbi:MAG: preprotein translocase subunit SecG [Burkholderiales bacterium]
MNMVLTAVLAVQMLSALGMIGLILVQHGKGADMGAAFGSGSSGSLFGASGSANFLSRTTGVLAAVFFVCTLALAYFSGGTRTIAPSGSVLDRPALNAPALSTPPPVTEGVGQIPSGASSAQPATAVDATPPAVPQPEPESTTPASGAAQIPAR